MKTAHFVEGLSNVTRFVEATKAVETRGSREASWMLAEGEPGYGKTNTLMWFATPRTPVFVRCKADYSPMWLLRDLAAALGVQAVHRAQALFDAVCAEIMANRCPPIIIDEIDHAARSVRVLETLRDITDTTECVLIAGGMKGSEAAMKRFPQIHSRIAEFVGFGPASLHDVQLVCNELSDVKIAPDLAHLIHAKSLGRLRAIKNMIARVEHAGRKRGGTMTLETWGNKPLVKEDRNRPALVASVAHAEAVNG